MLERRHNRPRPSEDRLPDSRSRRQPSPPPLPPSPSTAAAATSAEADAGNGGNVDRVLFRNLVEMVPLVESLMDRRAHSSFTRRASMVYTPAPTPSRKVTESKGGRASHTISSKKRRDLDNNAQRNNQNGYSDDLSIFSSRGMEAENALKERQELNELREQINDLQRKILEKDEALKSAESEINQMKASFVSIDELRLQVAEKDSLVKSINSQLNNAKIALADKQATLERLTWEAQMSNRRIEELQGEIISMDYEIAALMQIYEKLCANDSAVCPDKNSISYDLEPLPVADTVDDLETADLEEARATYIAAVAAAKGNPTEESLAIAAEARLRLHAFVI